MLRGLLFSFSGRLLLDRVIPVAGNLEKYYYHTNALGSVALLTDNSGFEVERYENDTYGTSTAFNPDFSNPGTESLFGNPYRFTSRHFDGESGLYYYRARHYHPVQGRFLQRDPIGIWGDDASAGNPYAYCGNNPVNFDDPSGTVTGGLVEVPAGVTAVEVVGGVAVTGGALVLAPYVVTAFTLLLVVNEVFGEKEKPKSVTIPQKKDELNSCISGNNHNEIVQDKPFEAFPELWRVDPKEIGILLNDPKSNPLDSPVPLSALTNTALEQFKKSGKIRCSIKPRNNCPPQCQNRFVEDGPDVDTATRRVRRACESAGCHKPGGSPGSPYNCNCGHLVCWPIK